VAVFVRAITVIIATPDELRVLLSYNPEDGKLYWKERPASMFRDDGAASAQTRCAIWNARFAGMPAFTADKGDGRRAGNIFGRTYLAHRVAWAVFYGAWPLGEIDHINGNTADNRIDNLRDVSRTVNSRNMPRRADNKSGATGVCRHQSKWMVRLGNKYVGVYGTFEEALAARKTAEAAADYHNNHGRVAA
jgi:hypothetical protein